MPKKGGKRVVDSQDLGGEEQKSAGGTDAPGPDAAAAPVTDPSSVAAAVQEAAQPSPSNDIEPPVAPAKGAQVPPGPAVVLPQMSARQTKAVGAWNTHKREVDKHFIGFFDGIGRDIAQVDKGIQSSAFAARETHKNVGIAKAYLSHISAALEGVDALVVPIVLQRDGNF